MRAIVFTWFIFLPFISYSQLFNPVLDQDYSQLALNGTLFGCGLSCYDVNNDGWDDITIGGKNTNIRLLLNQEGEFTIVNLGLYFTSEVKGLVWADYDNDGDEDLVVSLFNNSVKLYRNNGTLALTDVTNSAGLPVEATENWGVSWGDVNNDGFLDLYVCKYANHLQGLNSYARRNHLYLNNGNGTFSDITLSAGLDDGIKLSFTALFIDYDEDGFQDIYVINDKIYANSLYRNNGDLTFTEIGQNTGAGIIIDAMSASPGDWNNDLQEDIYITNTNGGNVLLQANPDLSFNNVAASLNVQIFHECWAANWFDSDNDMDLDLYVASSTGINGANPNHFFQNENGSLTEVCINTEFPDSPITFASGILDKNNDGFPDIINHNSFPSTFTIWQNSGNENHYIKLKLEGVLSNRNAVGTKIDVFTNGLQQRRNTYCGEGYLCQNSQYEIIGTGQNMLVDSLKLLWPSGIQEIYYNLPADSFYHFIEGSSFHLTSSITQDEFLICPEDSIEICVTEMHSFLWSTGDTTACVSAHSNSLLSVVGESFGAFTDTMHFEIMAHESEFPLLNITNPSCYLSSDGEVDIENQISFLELFWDDSPVFTDIESISAGFHELSWIDLNGCRDSYAIHIESPSPLMIENTVIQASYLTENSVSIAASGGIPPYTISWSNGAELWEASGLLAGDYNLTLTDARNCVTQSDFSIEEFTGIQELDEGISLFPNPTSEFINISLGTDKQVLINIHDSEGKLISSDYYSGSIRLSLKDLPPGAYILTFAGDPRLLPKRIVKQ